MIGAGCQKSASFQTQAHLLHSLCVVLHCGFCPVFFVTHLFVRNNVSTFNHFLVNIRSVNNVRSGNIVIIILLVSFRQVRERNVSLFLKGVFALIHKTGAPPVLSNLNYEKLVKPYANGTSPFRSNWGQNARNDFLKM